MTGPAGGTWLRLEAKVAGRRHECGVCAGSFTVGWAYYVGIVAHASVCEACVESMLDNPEECPDTCR